MSVFSDPAVAWTLGLAVGFPVASVALVELERVLGKRSPDAAKVCRLLQRTVLPPLALFLLLHRILNQPTDRTIVKVVLSVLSITGINALLVAVNAAMRAPRQGDGERRGTGILLDLARLFLVLLASAVVASSIWGVDLGGMLTALGVGSVVLGLALQDTVSGLFAGMSLLSGRHFKEGDWIESNGLEGRIVHMNWRTVTIETLDDQKLVVIPNSTLAGEPFTVVTTSSRTFGSNLEIRFAFGTPPAKAMDALERVIESVDVVLADPPYDIDIVAADGEGLLFDICMHAATRSDGDAAITEVIRKLWYLCQREGLVLHGGANTYSSHTKPPRPSRDELAQLLASTELFPGTAVGFDSLLDSARFEVYDDGEVLLSTPEPFDRLFLVVDGTLRVALGHGKQQPSVQEVEAGSAFVARALLSGGPSPVTLKAAGETSVLRLAVADVLSFLNQNPRLARGLERAIDVTEAGLRTTDRPLPF
jgi:small-conductance mechanosensitive channel